MVFRTTMPPWHARPNDYFIAYKQSMLYALGGPPRGDRKRAQRTPRLWASHCPGPPGQGLSRTLYPLRAVTRLGFRLIRKCVLGHCMSRVLNTLSANSLSGRGIERSAFQKRMVFWTTMPPWHARPNDYFIAYKLSMLYQA